jgi:hypothetical protein
MPMHDWKRAERDVFHDFHTAWIVEIRRALNAGILPQGYYALAEKTLRDMIPDVITMHRPAGSNGTGRRGHGIGGTLVETAPRARFTASIPPTDFKSIRRRIWVVREEDHHVVSFIEIVSPGNKSSKNNLSDFVGKVERAVDDGVHVLIVDPIPPGRRDPNGIHGAIWPVLGGEPFSAPADDPLTVVSYEATDGPRCYVNPFRVGKPVPDSPLFLEPGEFVNVPLEQTYMETWTKDVLPFVKTQLGE